MEHSLVNLAGIIVVGIAAHWLAWRIRLPSILLLLVSGFLVGGVTGWLDPDALLGDLLFPIVSLAVAVILFEGGLSLNVADLGAIRGVVRRLVTVGAVATWGLATLFGTILLDLDIPLAALLGAMLVVTGPTVIIPLLRQIRPKADLATVVRWEGIVNDPIGAILAVLVFDAIMASTAQGTISAAVLGVVRAVLAGGLLGALGAALMVVVLERH